MSIPKSETVSGIPRHFSVGAVIERGGSYLLIDRKVPPYGFAAPAGHIDDGETPEEALPREVKEETGLVVKDHELLIEEFVPNNRCSFEIDAHHWRVYRISTEGEAQYRPAEVKSIGWYTVDEMRMLPLEPIWKYWFLKLDILPAVETPYE